MEQNNVFPHICHTISFFCEKIFDVFSNYLFNKPKHKITKMKSICGNLIHSIFDAAQLEDLDNTQMDKILHATDPISFHNVGQLPEWTKDAQLVFGKMYHYLLKKKMNAFIFLCLFTKQKNELKTFYKKFSETMFMLVLGFERQSLSKRNARMRDVMNGCVVYFANKLV